MARGFESSRAPSRRLLNALAATAIATALGPASSLPATGATSQPHGAARPAAAAPYPPHCVHSGDALMRADELLANVYRLGPHPPVTLPADLAWNEDPLGDRNWQYQLHTTNFVRDLLFASNETGNDAYAARAVELLQDWLADNPKKNPPSPFSWNDHSTAWRAYSMACTADVLGLSEWLVAGLELHGKTLADPDFYVDVGNHALNQATALLEVGRVLGRADWVDLAAGRINTLVTESVDAQGVTNEQSVGYQYYNWTRYTDARERLLVNGLAPAPGFVRVDRMPSFLGHATLPNGEYEMLGDTAGTPAAPIPGTIAEFAATGGTSGPKPEKTVVVYRAGFLFARTGWGETRPIEDEVHVSLRWGPAPYIHGHNDGLALTMYGYGSRLLLDSGAYSYDADAWRRYFKSRAAHNVVVVKGLDWNTRATTELRGHESGTRYTYVRLRTFGNPGVKHVRRVLFSRQLGYAIVEDRLSSSTARTFRQLWHLAPDANPVVTSNGVRTRAPGGNVLIRQLTGKPGISFVTGATDPIQGWVSFRHKQKRAAPVLRATQRGTSVRYLTLIVPGGERPAAKIGNLRLTSTGYSFTITIDGRSERVVVSGSSASIKKVS